MMRASCSRPPGPTTARTAPSTRAPARTPSGSTRRCCAAASQSPRLAGSRRRFSWAGAALHRIARRLCREPRHRGSNDASRAAHKVGADPMMTLFMFTTGIENSYPTVGQRRVDEMEKGKHYERWREDFALLEDLGIRFLRYGPPLHKTFLGPDRFDWEFSDLAFGQLKKQDVTPIADLCHFGVPDWIGDFQNQIGRASCRERV